MSLKLKFNRKVARILPISIDNFLQGNRQGYPRCRNFNNYFRKAQLQCVRYEIHIIYIPTWDKVGESSTLFYLETLI